MATPKVIVELYPMLPAENRADRERRRPLGRNADVYQEVLQGSIELVKGIDALGAWGIATIEHHLHSEGYEVSPNPGILNAWWASHVKNAHLGALGYVMATRDPIRVAEETAILDHITKGRYFVGVTRGYQSRWANILGQHHGAVATLSDGGADDKKNRALFEERVGLLLECWTQDSVASKTPHYEIPYPHDTGIHGYPGRFSAATGGAEGEVGPDGSIQRISVVPSPYTKPHPPLFSPVSASIESIPFLARHGIRPTYFSGLEDIKKMAQSYVDVARDAGHDFAFGERQNLARWVHFGKDQQDYRNRLLKYDHEMWVNFYEAFFPTGMDLTNTEEVLTGMADSGIFTGGTVEQTKAQWRKIYEAVPCEYITLIWHYAQCPTEVVLEELELFMTQVLPELEAPG